MIFATIKMLFSCLGLCACSTGVWWDGMTMNAALNKVVLAEGALQISSGSLHGKHTFIGILQVQLSTLSVQRNVSVFWG